MSNETWNLRLLGTWQLFHDGHVVDIPNRQQRLIALIAVQGERTRSFIASELWPESSNARSASNLRNTIWNVSRHNPGLLDLQANTIALSRDVSLDLRRLHALLEPTYVPGDAD